MPRKIELKPDERLIIGNAAIRNGPRRSSFVIETNTKVPARERHHHGVGGRHPVQAALFRAETLMYLADDPTLAENSFVEQSNALMEAAPSYAALPSPRSTSKCRAATCIAP